MLVICLEIDNKFHFRAYYLLYELNVYTVISARPWPSLVPEQDEARRPRR